MQTDCASAVASSVESDYSAETEAPDWRALLGLQHGMPNEQYQRGPGVSNSGLKALRKSPWHYHALHHLPRPKWFLEDFDADTTTALFAGTLCHCATLEPQEFDKRYVVGPEGVNKNTKEWKAFVLANAPRTVISAKQYAVAHGQAAALRAVPAVAEILDGGECEVSGYWLDPATGVLCRCRPDCMNRTFGTPDAPAIMLLDPKTTTDASDAAVKNTIARYGYHHQAEWYSRGIAQATGLPVAGFIFAFVESSYPFACSVHEIDPDSYDVARRENREALQLYAACTRSGVWPGYSQEVKSTGLPRWAGGGD
jgi:exodeoxyribonuclease VIII